MNLFRKSKTIEFDEKSIEVYEITPANLIKIASGEYKSNNEMLLDCCSLGKDEFEKISIEALNRINEVFTELNEEHLSYDKKGGSIDKGE